MFSLIYSRSSLKSLKSLTSKSKKKFTNQWQSSAEVGHNIHYCTVFDSRGWTDYLKVLAPCDQLILGALPTIIGDISI